MYRLSFIGLGSVGLCTAVCFATKGYKVIGSEIDRAKASQIRRGNPPFYEPSLNKLLVKAIKTGNLKITSNNEEAILKSDITFITVGTPSKTDGSISLSYVIKASREVGKALKKKDDRAAHLVVVKSTVTPGATQDIVRPTIERNSGRKCCEDFLLCANPEFLSEGNAVRGTLNPDYVVIGGCNERSADMLEHLYREFYSENLPPIIRTNVPTAELIKYANNALLATKVSFINTIANMCEKTPGTDVRKIAEAIGKDHRINPYFLDAGLGWGGSCFPKDVKALISFSKGLGYNPELIQAAWKINEDQVRFTIQKAKKELGVLRGKNIAILGLAFKPNTDDLREARSLELIKGLLKQGAAIRAYDPMAIANTRRILKEKIGYASSAVECLKSADCAILVTEWEEFKKLGPEDFTRNMRKPFLIDGRRIYDPEKFSKKLRYVAVGLGEPAALIPAS
jgi:UDPglucose 6-dehydrogenase